MKNDSSIDESLDKPFTPSNDSNDTSTDESLDKPFEQTASHTEVSLPFAVVVAAVFVAAVAFVVPFVDHFPHFILFIHLTFYLFPSHQTIY